MIEIAQAPNKKVIDYGIKIFIAGGISNCPNWQDELVKKIIYDKRIKNDKDVKIVLFNPRCKEIPDEDTQITWEFDRLKTADIVSFWFSEGSLNPITLFEYGSHLNSNKELVVGCHPNYERRNNVILQTKLLKPNQIVNEDFDSFYETLVEKIIEKIGFQELADGFYENK